MSKELILGVDIGGSHITAGIVNLEERRFLSDTQVRKRVNAHASADEIINIWADTIRVTMDTNLNKFSRIGIAMPGPFDYENGISLIKGFDKYEALYGLSIKNALVERLGILGENIVFRNDAEAYLEGEIFSGAAKGFKNVIGITLGTGVGSAKSKDGVTVDAELSVLPYKNGIAEDYISTRGILKNYYEIAGVKLNDVKALADEYHYNPNARKAFAMFSKDLAWFLEVFIRAEAPEVLVIGGNIANAWDYFMRDVVDELSPYLSTLKIVKAQLGEAAALIGSACYWENQLVKI